MVATSADYRVSEAGSPDDLARQVRVYLQDNWLPQGGMVVIPLGNDDYLYAQAMVFNVK